MHNNLLIILGNAISRAIQALKLGNGSTWPGHIALSINTQFIHDLLKKNPQLKVIIVAGTNGKTTTSIMLKTILESSGKRVIQNASGANLQSGIASSLLLAANIKEEIAAEYAIFEVDENAFPKLAEELKPSFIVFLNLFRDQLDRYGEVNTIATKWKHALGTIDTDVQIIANADDPLIVGICEEVKQKKHYFGLEDGKKTKTEHSADSAYCPRCGKKLLYASVQFSHLGDWKCPSCGLKRPKVFTKQIPMPLLGSYNQYNGLGAYLTAHELGIDDKPILKALSNISPAFGRQEIFERDGRTMQIFLSKNPTGMNESLRTIQKLGGNYLLFLLNDRIPDGTDVSWIWDVDFEDLLKKDAYIFASGDRAFDMSLRIKYAHPTVNHVDTYEVIDRAFEDIVMRVPKGETLYVLPTYSAMLEIRKMLTGRKIL